MATESKTADVNVTNVGQAQQKMQAEKDEQLQIANAMNVPDPSRQLKIYPMNRYVKKSGKAPFDTTCMNGKFPLALISYCQKPIMVSRHFGKPASYSPLTKRVTHFQPGFYSIHFHGKRRYANGNIDKHNTKGILYFKFQDDIDTNNEDKEPETV